MKNLVIIGFTCDSAYEVRSFSVNKAYRNSDEFLGLPLVDLEDLSKLYPKSDYEVFVALASEKLNYNRTKLYKEK